MRKSVTGRVAFVYGMMALAGVTVASGQTYDHSTTAPSDQPRAGGQSQEAGPEGTDRRQGYQPASPGPDKRVPPSSSTTGLGNNNGGNTTGGSSGGAPTTNSGRPN